MMSLIKQTPKGFLSHVTRKMNAITDYLSTNDPEICILEILYIRYEQRYEEMVKAYKRMLNEEGVDIDYLKEWFLKREEDHTRFSKYFEESCINLQNGVQVNQYATTNIRPEDSISNVSAISSTKSLILQKKAKIAADRKLLEENRKAFAHKANLDEQLNDREKQLRKSREDLERRLIDQEKEENNLNLLRLDGEEEHKLNLQNARLIGEEEELVYLENAERNTENSQNVPQFVPTVPVTTRDDQRLKTWILDAADNGDGASVFNNSMRNGNRLNKEVSSLEVDEQNLRKEILRPGNVQPGIFYNHADTLDKSLKNEFHFNKHLGNSIYNQRGKVFANDHSGHNFRNQPQLSHNFASHAKHPQKQVPAEFTHHTNPNHSFNPPFPQEQGHREYNNNFLQQDMSNNYANLFSKQTEILQQLVNSSELSNLPKREVPMFDGRDITLFPSFMQTFKRLIHDKCSSNEDRLYYLTQFTKGHPLQLIQSCSHNDATEAYHAAINLLHDEYGTENRLASAYLNKLKNFPQMDAENRFMLNRFLISLMECNNYMKNYSVLHVLNNPIEIRNLVLKLPLSVREKWRETYFSLGCQVNFDIFVNFVKAYNNTKNDPYFGDVSDHPPSHSIKSSNNFSNQKRRVLNTKIIKICKYCNKNNHNISNCFAFKKIDVNERWTFVKKAQLCMSCLEPGHHKRQCPKSLKCDSCNFKHATILHDDNFRPNIRQNSNVNTGASNNDQVENLSASIRTLTTRTYDDNATKIQHPMMPIILSIKDKYIKTYLVLDSCSSDVLIDNSLLSKLGLKSRGIPMDITTIGGAETTLATVINNLVISTLDRNYSLNIPVSYAINNWTFTKEDTPSPSMIDNYPHLHGLPFQFIDSNVGILVGMNHPELFTPHEIVQGKENEPFASYLRLGWTLCGPFNVTAKKFKCLNTKICKGEVDVMLENLFSQDFKDSASEEFAPSPDDLRWQKIVTKSLVHLPNKHFQVDLPLKNQNETFPSNRYQVLQIHNALLNKFKKNPQLHKDYTEFMQMMYEKGFMEEVPNNTNDNKRWYISHHGVYHKQKNKLRVVFHCSLKYQGISLNDRLLSGPDLANNILGVLLRFRQGPYAFMADIEKMFYAVKVPEQHRDMLRFFWSFDNSLAAKEYRLNVHLFGATSSPAVANYCLKETTKIGNYSEKVKSIVHRNFYVDDCAYSGDDEDEVSHLYSQVKSMVLGGGFNLTGLVSNSRKLLQSVPKSECGKNLQDIDFFNEDLPQERALGILWSITGDFISFKVCLPNQPITRRGILSNIHSIYDPLGLAGPATIVGKAIFQEACSTPGWDSKLPQNVEDKWKSWLQDLPLLENYKVPRCIKSRGTIIKSELHYFSDGSETAYASIVYARFVYADRSVTCSPVLAKVRLTPSSKNVLKTIPRIELNGARLSVKLQQILKRELDINIDRELFWTDSSTVLKYINNESKRLQRFVGNRVNYIRSHTTPDQWRHIVSEENPADIASCGINVSKLTDCQLWNKGPKFLTLDESHWSVTSFVDVPEEDMEYRKEVKVKLTTMTQYTDLTDRYLEACSNWHRLKRRVTWLRRFQGGLKSKNFNRNGLTLSELKQSEIFIIRYVQQKEFKEVIFNISKSIPNLKNRTLQKLSPFLDENGLLRVGGRLQHAKVAYSIKHPIILPGSSHISKIIVEEIHMSIGHLGRESVLSHLRRRYWVISGNSLVKRIIGSCVQCRKMHSRVSQQIMAPLPKDRLCSDDPPFASTGVDYFGPFHVVNGRRSEKRYGVIFTCLSSRSVHLEMSSSLDTDSFINALRRFIARRGSIKLFRSDNGTNFTGGYAELKRAIKGWNNHHIESWLQQRNIEWIFQPPASSHYGGAFERLIRSVRSVLQGVLHEQPCKLNDEGLNTLLCEVEGILNSRPLTEISDDPNDLDALTPNHILLKNEELTFPPGLFNPKDRYLRRKWPQVQYITDLFWTRWRREYLPMLQKRQKWVHDKTNHKVGDLVLVVDQLLPRNQWCLGRIVETFPGNDGKVRHCRVIVAKYKDAKKHPIGNKILERPITKLILLREESSL